MNEAELDEWEKNQSSFVSYRSVFKKASEEWGALINTVDTIALLGKYKDILTSQNGHLVPTIPVKFYQTICNREGYYQTGKVMNRVIGPKIYSIAKEGMDKLVSPNESTPSEVQVQTYLLGTESKEIKMNSRIEAECGNSMNASYFDDPSGCNSDRIVYLSFRQSLKTYSDYFLLTDGLTRYYLTHDKEHVDIWANDSKKNSLCTWHDNYNTLFDTRNVYVTVYGYYNGASTPTYYTNPISGAKTVINTNSVLRQFSLQYFDYTGATEEVAHTIASNDIGDWAINTTLVAPLPVSVHAEARTRGSIGWAIINCP